MIRGGDMGRRADIGHGADVSHGADMVRGADMARGDDVARGADASRGADVSQYATILTDIYTLASSSDYIRDREAEEAKKAELEETIQKLMADGVSAAEILEKLK